MTRRFRHCLLAVWLAVATVMAGLPAVAAAKPRPPATPSWYAPDLRLLRSLGLAGSAFDPGAPLSRGTFAVLLQTLFGLPAPRPCVALFADVPPTAPDAGPIAAVLRAGWMSGVGYRRFLPDAPVTRAEAVATVVRALGLPAGGRLRFSDAARIPAWAVPDVRAAVAAGLVHGFPDGRFRPDAPLDWAQATRLLAAVYRLRHPTGSRLPAPAPPRGVGFAAAGSRVQLVWRTVYGANGYVVERRSAQPGWCWHTVATGVEPPLAAAGFGGSDQGDLRIVDITRGSIGWGLEVPARPPYGDGYGLDYLTWGGAEIRVAFPASVPHPNPGDRLDVLYAPTGVVACTSSGDGWCWPRDTLLAKVRWTANGSLPGVAVDPAKATVTLTTWRLRAGRRGGPHDYRILARSADGLLSEPSRAVAGPRLAGERKGWARYGFTPALSLALQAVIRRGPGASVNLGGLRLGSLPALPADFRDSGRQLFFADSPEQATRPAVLYRAAVRGAVRAYYDVTNVTGHAANVGVVLTDTGPSTVPYAVYGGRESANLDVQREGIDVSAAMLQGLQPPATGRLQPGESIVLDPLSPTIRPWYSLLGYRDLWVGGPARLSFLLAPAPWDAALYWPAGGLQLAPPATKPWDGAGRGVFTHALRQVTLRPPAASPAVTYLAGRGDPFVRASGPGGDAGNYGVVYRIHGRPSVTTALVAVPVGGPYLGVLGIGGQVVQAPRVPPPAAYPGAFLCGVWPAGRESTIEWTPPGGSSLPLALVSIPLGGAAST